MTRTTPLRPGCITLGALGALLWSAALTQGAPAPGHYLRNPAGHGSTVVFELDDHIWRQQGDGIAERITDEDVRETVPALSPDGSLVAYVAVMGASQEV